MSLATIRNLLALTAVAWACPPALALETGEADRESRHPTTKQQYLPAAHSIPGPPLTRSHGNVAGTGPAHLKKMDQAPFKKGLENKGRHMRNKTIYDFITTTRSYWMDDDSINS